MQERQVTIGPQSYALPDPFVVMATMNPLDSEGTYALPIAQMDRFLMKVNVGYPSREEELRILDRFAVADTQPVRAVATLEDVRAWRAQAHAVHVDEKLKRYIVELVATSRQAGNVIGAFELRRRAAALPSSSTMAPARARRSRSPSWRVAVRCSTGAISRSPTTSARLQRTRYATVSASTTASPPTGSPRRT